MQGNDNLCTAAMFDPIFRLCVFQERPGFFKLFGTYFELNGEIFRPKKSGHTAALSRHGEK